MGYWINWITSAVSDPQTLMLVCCCLLSFLWQCMAIAVSRQWFLVPIVCGLTGLAGFLLNPLADSRSLIDLRAQFTEPNNLAILGAVNLVAIATSLTVGARVAGKLQSQRWRVLLGYVHCLPAPAILLSLLLIENSLLSNQVGARPELIGLLSGIFAALALLVGIFVASLLSRIRQAQIHLFTCLLLAALTCLSTTIDRALPTTDLAGSDRIAIQSMLWALVFASVLLAIGVVLERRRQKVFSNQLCRQELG